MSERESERVEIVNIFLTIESHCAIEPIYSFFVVRERERERERVMLASRVFLRSFRGTTRRSVLFSQKRNHLKGFSSMSSTSSTARYVAVMAVPGVISMFSLNSHKIIIIALELHTHIMRTSNTKHQHTQVSVRTCT